MECGAQEETVGGGRGIGGARGNSTVLFYPHYYSVGDRALIRLPRQTLRRAYLWMDSLLTFGRPLAAFVQARLCF